MPETTARETAQAVDTMSDTLDRPVGQESQGAPSALAESALQGQLVPAVPEPGELAPWAGARELLEAWLSSKSPHTLRAYRADVGLFARWVGAPGPNEAIVYLIGRPHGEANLLALRWRESMHAEGLAPATISRRLYALSSLVEMAQTLGLVPWSLKVPKPKIIPYRDCRGPSLFAWETLLSRAETDASRPDSPRRAALAIRNLAILLLLRDRALRRHSVAALELGNVNLLADPPSLWIRSKGFLELKSLPLNARTAHAVRMWIQVRGEDPGPLFYRLDHETQERRALNEASIERLLTRLCKRAKIARVRPHGLRHHAVTQAGLLSNGNVLVMQGISGHRSLRTLSYYVDNLQDYSAQATRLIGGES